MVALRRKTKQKLFIFMIFIMLVIFFLYMIEDNVAYNQYPELQNSRIHIQKFPNRQFVHKDIRTVLFWTTFFRSPFNLENNRRCLATCPYNCEVTDDKSKIEDADAVFFHLSDLWTSHWSIGTKSIVKLPSYRRPDQVWVVSNMEPPPHHWGDLIVFNSLFNWTAWYRQDSDVQMPYGKIYELNATERTLAAKQEATRNYFKEKTHLAVVRIGNCFDPGRRYKYIKQMDKYLDIDKYGKCYGRVCGDSTDPRDQSCENIISQYKFYLAFENSNCRDYITEKYWLTLARDQIPIVNWKGFDYENLAIPGTYININDFDSLKDLGIYINKVANNATLYNSYFRYKLTYKNQAKVCPICNLCRDLHTRSKPAQVYVNMDAWVRDDTCEKVGKWNNLMKNYYGWRFKLLGF